MERRSIVGYIFLGTALRYLQDVSAGAIVDGEGYVMNNAELLRRWCEYLKMPTSVRAYDELVQPLLDGYKGKARLEEADAVSLGAAANTFRAVLFAEAGGVMTHVAVDRRSDVSKLLERPAELLAAGVFLKL